MLFYDYAHKFCTMKHYTPTARIVWYVHNTYNFSCCSPATGLNAVLLAEYLHFRVHMWFCKTIDRHLILSLSSLPV